MMNLYNVMNIDKLPHIFQGATATQEIIQYETWVPPLVLNNFMNIAYFNISNGLFIWLQPGYV